MSTILTISNPEELNNFCKKYTKAFQYYSYFQAIDWWEVAKKYGGIELLNYHTLKWQSDMMAPIWVNGWDVNGGCVWDLKAIKNVREYAENQAT